MSLNLGNDVSEAALALRADPHFAALRAGMAKVVNDKISQALDSPVEQRVEATAYARALRDVWVALEAGAQNVRANTVKLPRTPVEKA